MMNENEFTGTDIRITPDADDMDYFGLGKKAAPVTDDNSFGTFEVKQNDKDHNSNVLPNGKVKPEFYAKWANDDCREFRAHGPSYEYIPWAAALAHLRTNFPYSDFRYLGPEMDLNVTASASLPISFMDPRGQCFYDEKLGYFVAVQLTLDGEHWLPPVSRPVMDHRNYTMFDHETTRIDAKGNERTVKAADANDINNAQKRCLTKAIAEQTGFGLRLWMKDETGQISPMANINDIIAVADRMYKIGYKSESQLVAAFNDTKRFKPISSLREMTQDMVAAMHEQADYLEAVIAKKKEKAAGTASGISLPGTSDKTPAPEKARADREKTDSRQTKKVPANTEQTSPAPVKEQASEPAGKKAPAQPSPAPAKEQAPEPAGKKAPAQAGPARQTNNASAQTVQADPFEATAFPEIPDIDDDIFG